MKIRRFSAARSLLVAIGLAAIVCIAGYLRLVGIDWDDNQHLHPDERFLTMVTSALLPVKSIGEYFNTSNSTLNPNNVGFGFFVYGDLPVIATRFIGGMLDKTSYYDVYLVGRALSAGADLLVLLLIFAIGQTLFDWRAGILGALLYGAAALPIQLSHFYTVDTLANLFVVASFLFIARLVKRNSWIDCIAGGLCIGLAVASKINVFPLGILLGLVVLLRAIREKQQHEASADVDIAKPWSQFLIPAMAGIALAGAVSIVTFRVSQPYAFLPPNSGVPINQASLGPTMTVISRVLDPVGFRPSPDWLSQMNEVRGMVSGYSDIPPNHQWGARLPVIFPWINMVRVGLGWPFGVFCWLMLFLTCWEIWKQRDGYEQLLPLVIWIAVYFVWQGIAWVKTMRYFLPVYPFLILLAGWGMTVIWDRVQGLLKNRGIHRWHWSSLSALGIGAGIILSGYSWGFAVSRIYTRPVTRIEATKWILDNVPSDVGLHLSTANGGRTFQLGLHNNVPFPGTPEDQQDPARPDTNYTQIEPGTPNIFPFELPFSGRLTDVSFNRIVSTTAVRDSQTLVMIITDDPTGSRALTNATIESDFAPGADSRGRAYVAHVTPVDLAANSTYYLVLRWSGTAPLNIMGSTITTEGDWDDPIPLSQAPYDVWGAQFQGYKLQMAWEDLPEKRERIKYILDNTDYLTISSNRFYASMSRNPNRFPLTIAYYKALFSGSLGFDLVGDFTSRPNIGPLQFFDDDAEEAWTVYDHPRVFIFRKSAHYDPAQVAALLDQVDLNNVQRVIAKDAKGSPVKIDLPVLRPSADTLGLVKPDKFLNGLQSLYRSLQPLTVIIWWLSISVIGWVAFPILFAIFRGLPDRGYGFARIFGMLLVAWASWIIASLRLGVWSPLLILGVTATVAVLSYFVLGRQREEFRAWMTQWNRHLFVVEVIAGLLFLFFIFVRFGNPDLWHPSFGGEKPMDMSYFNAVLKSTYFPPYDPWFAGGTINYYYFGFVIAAIPVKLLSIPTSLAYNLLIPTFFSLTGCGVFSLVFNLIASSDKLDSNSHHNAPLPLIQALRSWPRTSLGDLQQSWRDTWQTPALAQSLPYLGGIAALLLAAVLGNLDQIRTLLWGLAELGAGKPSWADVALPPLTDIVAGISQIFEKGSLLPVGLGEWYWNATRLIPVPISNGVPTEVGPITEFPYFSFLYADLHAHVIAMPLTLLAIAWGVSIVKESTQNSPSNFSLIAIQLLIGGLVIGALRPTNTWDFPTYLLVSGSAIVISVYAKRHNESAFGALGVALVAGLILGVSGFAFALTQSTPVNGTQGLLPIMLGGALGFIGIFVGYGIGLVVLRPRAPMEIGNGVIYHWLSLIQGVTQFGVLVGLTYLLFLPFITTYKLGYTSFTLWEGSRTPLWAFVDILGLPLFVIATWLICEGLDWLEDKRSSGSINRASLVLGILAGLMLLAASVIISIQGFPVIGVTTPIIAVSLLLAFRENVLTSKRFILGLVAIALLLTCLVEVVVLAGDISRMNTVFKFYLQVWIMLAIAAGAGLGWVWGRIRNWREPLKTGWRICFSVLMFLAALYPLIATRAKIQDRWSTLAPASLDGMAFMPYVERNENGVVFSLKGDYAVLRWLQDEIGGTPVTLEAHTVEYNWGSRVAVYTGLPTVLGWNWHQRQQRGDQSNEVWAREADIDVMYNSTNMDQVVTLLRRYNVQLIIVGDLERAYYSTEGLEKFRSMAQLGYLTVLYDQDNTIVYGVMSQ